MVSAQHLHSFLLLRAAARLSTLTSGAGCRQPVSCGTFPVSRVSQRRGGTSMTNSAEPVRVNAHRRWFGAGRVPCWQGTTTEPNLPASSHRRRCLPKAPSRRPDRRNCRMLAGRDRLARARTEGKTPIAAIAAEKSTHGTKRPRRHNSPPTLQNRPRHRGRVNAGKPNQTA